MVRVVAASVAGMVRLSGSGRLVESSELIVIMPMNSEGSSVR